MRDLRASPWFKVCRDIADASKHFALTPDRAGKTNVTHADSAQGFGVCRYGKGAYGVGEEAIKITLDDGTEFDAVDLACELMGLFEPFFHTA